jgi:hypothetical protein
VSSSLARVEAPSGKPDPGDFVLLSIVKVEAPPGCTGSNWLRYQIRQGTNVIDGYRSGTVSSVRAHVDAVILALNGRRTVKRGRVELPAPARRTEAEEV